MLVVKVTAREACHLPPKGSLALPWAAVRSCPEPAGGAGGGGLDPLGRLAHTGKAVPTSVHSSVGP